MICRKAREIDLAAYLVEPGSAEWSEFRQHWLGCTDCSQELDRWTHMEEGLRKLGRMEHLEAELLARLANEPDSLPPVERAAADAHVESCGSCRAELRALRSFDFAAAAARARAAAAEARSEQAEARPERAQARREQPPVRRVVASETFSERLTRWLGSLFTVPAMVPVGVAAALLVGLAMASVWRAGLLEPGQEPTTVARQERPVPQALPLPPDLVEPKPIETSPSNELSAQTDQRPKPDESPGPVLDEPPAAEARETMLAETRPPAPQTIAPAPPAHEVSEPSRPSGERDAAPLDEPILIAALATTPLLQYDMPLGASPFVRDAVIRGREAPRVQALAPDHVGLTRSASPVLYWYLPEASDRPVEVVVSDERREEPLLEKRLAPPVAKGLHRIALADAGIRLDPGVSYAWSVSIVIDPEQRARDVVSLGAIQRTAADGEVGAELEAEGPGLEAHVYARHGLWYDALTALSLWIDDHPGEARLREQRSALLRQVGLEPIDR